MAITITFKYSKCYHYFSRFESILNLKNYNDIDFIDCRYRQLKYLPDKLPDSLKNLLCCANDLTILPPLPQTLKSLWCSHNKITKLPSLPENLEYLYIPNNMLEILPSCPKSLKYIFISNNNLIELPFIGRRCHMEYEENPIANFVNKFFKRDMDEYYEWKNKFEKKFVKKIETWFLKCKYNPEYLYCRNFIMKGYDGKILI